MLTKKHYDMTANFDRNFEKNKESFKEKFGIEWNKDYNLYLIYLQTLYLSTLTEMSIDGLNRILVQQEELKGLVQSISQNSQKS
jgi:hypothetical protein